MKYKNSAYIFLIFALVISCTSHRITKSSKLVMRKIENESIFNNRHRVKIDFVEVYNQNYKFEVFVRNKSKDSIFVTPALIKYRIISESVKGDSTFVNAINPEEEIKQLSIQLDSLKNNKNPYSLLGKSTKEVVTDGIIAGTLGVIFGRSGDDIETQRQKNEDDWAREHDFKTNSVNRELIFWNNEALLPQMIPPMSEVSGKILFPVSLNANKIKVEVPIESEIYNFIFEQLKL